MPTILHGDCRTILPTLPENSIDAIITDPPYHLTSSQGGFGHNGDVNQGIINNQFGRLNRGFMGQQWDGGNVAFRPEVWRECLRVLKPGGHLIVFGGTRTHHRLWCAVEDAGFEIRDCLMWVHGQGFPKSLDVAKSIQSAQRQGNARFANNDAAAFDQTAAVPLPDQMWVNSAALTAGTWTGHNAVVSDAEAAPWQGWGSALKPAYEPILLARKPLDGTIAANVLKHGVGGLNIDTCRVPGEAWSFTHSDKTSRSAGIMGDVSGTRHGVAESHPEGRWPTNTLLDGSDEVTAMFPQSKGNRGGDRWQAYADDGSAARYFPALGFTEAERLMYHRKANKSDRAGSKHPTVKPIRLLEWLCKLICPPGGTILDPFAGSGTTGEAAVNLGFSSILIEQDATYVEDIKRRFRGPVG